MRRRARSRPPRRASLCRASRPHLSRNLRRSGSCAPPDSGPQPHQLPRAGAPTPRTLPVPGGAASSLVVWETLQWRQRRSRRSLPPRRPPSRLELEGSFCTRCWILPMVRQRRAPASLRPRERVWGRRRGGRRRRRRRRRRPCASGSQRRGRSRRRARRRLLPRAKGHQRRRRGRAVRRQHATKAALSARQPPPHRRHRRHRRQC
mmetsp:Transcript_5233/g.16802  ORF Transcript_5233/g.16802 Transcript_5233/m.16802 type:complete len:205 (-) Transcript_5233:313-927(-)